MAIIGLGTSITVFLCFTVLIMGGAAVLTGRALALSWRSPWQVIFSCLGLGLVDRFFVYALFDGALSSIVGYLVHTMTIMTIGIFAYRVMYVSVMVQQYPWLFRRSSLLTYRTR